MHSFENLQKYIKNPTTIYYNLIRFKNPKNILFYILNRLTRPYRLRKYFNDYNIYKLHIGCGSNIINGWLNTDLISNFRVIYLNVIDKFPFCECIFDYVFSEHLIEHFDYLKGKDIIRECFRILKPGGKIRISTPDFQFLFRLYDENKTEEQKRYIAWAVDTYLPSLKIYQDIFVINRIIRGWGHKFIYDYKALSVSMIDAGFINIKRYAVKESNDCNFQDIESHGVEEFNKLEAFCLEAEKPSEK
jgi:predicted SAM-dependent methyltransferase